MGYYTRFSLACEPSDTNAIEKLRERSEDARYAIDDDGDTADRARWNDYRKDLLALSLEYPSVLFRLSGEGQGAGDIWEADFQAGKKKIRKAQIIIPPFDSVAWE